MGLYLLVLLCPLSHIFLMNHGSYERKKDHADSENSNISNLSVVQTGNKLIDK
ncbi:MAG: DUF2933 domain-containing protein [Candidatus Dojkabacteria bacterium]|nr:DUF2933 domain-containing protein [Candidatus Dojkabacteria bacterium]